MRIPKVITRDDYVYILEKEYPNYCLYKNLKTGTKECFQRFDLIEENLQKRRGAKYNWEKEMEGQRNEF